MIIKEINIQNFKSFGNKLQRVRFDEDGELILLCGGNGKGKCLSPDTTIDILIENGNIKTELLKFLENRKNPL